MLCLLNNESIFYTTPSKATAALHTTWLANGVHGSGQLLVHLKLGDGVFLEQLLRLVAVADRLEAAPTEHHARHP